MVFIHLVNKLVSLGCSSYKSHHNNSQEKRIFSYAQIIEETSKSHFWKSLHQSKNRVGWDILIAFTDSSPLSCSTCHFTTPSTPALLPETFAWNICYPSQWPREANLKCLISPTLNKSVMLWLKVIDLLAHSGCHNKDIGLSNITKSFRASDIKSME